MYTVNLNGLDLSRRGEGGEIPPEEGALGEVL